MRAVNLLPRDAGQGKSIREEDPAVVVGSAVGVVVLIALAGAFMTAHSKAGTQQARLDKARQELAQLSLRNRTDQHTQKGKPVQIIPIVPAPAVTGQEAVWTSAVSAALSQRIAWDRILREVSLVMPTDVTLNSLTLSAPTVATTPGAAGTPSQGFAIGGDAYSYDSVARLLSRLALIPDLSDVTLTSTSQGSGENVAFNIIAAVKGGVAAPVAPAPVIPPVTDTTSGATS
jgi:Tfp pilus assembly protein PilN